MSTAYQDISAYTRQIYSGRWNEAPLHLKVHEIATQREIAEVGAADEHLLGQAVANAKKAQAEWAARPFLERADVLAKATALFDQQRAAFHDWLVRESGSIQIKAYWEVEQSYRTLQQSISYPAQATGQILPSSVPGRQNVWRRLPVGVVGVITPWNFPLLLALRSVAPALALGNAVVLKPDIHTPISGGLLLARLFEDAGLPQGLFHVLPGDGALGNALVEHPQVGQISFTGSTSVGRQIGAKAGQALKKVSLELGGNNAYVVLDDADVEIAASNGAWGSFLHQGQICLQTGRHIVHRSLHDAYVKRLASKAEALVIGDPSDAATTLGPLINEKQIRRLEDIIQRAVAAGAKVVTGGKRREGLCYEPTVLVDVEPDNPALVEELFGPVAVVIAFDTDEQALELVNASEYGLSAGVQSADPLKAQRLVDRFEAIGMVHVNDQTVNNEAHIPFGGLGASGAGGKFGGPANPDEFTHSQWISLSPQAALYPF